MALARDDRWLSDALGRALAGAQVFWCTQPATVPTAPPPSPLAAIFTSLTGSTPITQPVLTDGFGHAFAYMDASVLYTVVVYHPLFGPNPIVLPDQTVGGSGGGGSSLVPFAGIPSGTIDGSNTIFTLTNAGTPIGLTPVQVTAWLNFPLIQGLGFSLGPAAGQITFAVAPQPPSGGGAGDAIFAQGFYI